MQSGQYLFPALYDVEACRMRESCVTCICQLVNQMAPLKEFRLAEHAATQDLILTKLVKNLEQVPKCPTSYNNVDLLTIFRHVCDTMTSVLRDQRDAKRVILERGGVPHLVRLLSSVDNRVQRASTSVLRTLAFKEDVAKRAIVANDAVQPLIRMLRSEVRSSSALYTFNHTH